MDMLVRLYNLPPCAPVFDRLRQGDIEIRRALAPEKSIATTWVQQKFSDTWANEAEIAFTHQPVSCFIAVKNGRIIGFACHDATYRGSFGPTGVEPAERSAGVGTALLLACLEDMRHQGFGYAIIGGVGPAEYYSRAVGAVLIEGSEPGVYRGLLGSARFGDPTA
jgi:predicted N-acetyltransferase YhbS